MTTPTPRTETDEDRESLARGEIPAHIAMPSNVAATPLTDELLAKARTKKLLSSDPRLPWYRLAVKLERELAAALETIREHESTISALTDTVEYWEGSHCGGDCLAAPCSMCDGTLHVPGEGAKLGERLGDALETIRERDAEIARLRGFLRAIADEIDDDPKQGPGHGHSIPGIWDRDNGDKAGKPCEWCALWKEIRQAYRRDERGRDA